VRALRARGAALAATSTRTIEWTRVRAACLGAGLSCIRVCVCPRIHAPLKHARARQQSQHRAAEDLRSLECLVHRPKCVRFVQQAKHWTCHHEHCVTHAPRQLNGTSSASFFPLRCRSPKLPLTPTHGHRASAPTHATVGGAPLIGGESSSAIPAAWGKKRTET